MIELKLEEASSLTLNMKLEGDVAGTPQLRFSILSEGMRYTFEATANGNGEFEVQFPVLEGKLDAGTYNAEVEILVDNKHFVPLQETVKLTKEVKPVVKLAEAVKKVQEASVEIKVGAPKAVKPIKDAKSLLESVQDGDTVNTGPMLVGLTKLAEAEKLSEKEALASFKMIEFYGTDISVVPEIGSLVNLSEAVRTELVSVLRDKGISTRKLKDIGLL